MKTKKKIAAPSRPAHPLRLVFGLYFVSFVIRAIFNASISNFPTVWVDESMYINIAQSLAYNGTLSFRMQPVDYPFILYPIFLTPVYLLSRVAEFEIFKGIVVWNTLLMTSAVLPAYFFARDFTGDERKALTVSFLTALAPDLMLSNFVMVESLIWPLTLWLVYFAWRTYAGRGKHSALWTAVFTGLMFFAKPGSIVIGLVLLGGEMALTWKQGREKRKEMLSAMLVLLGIVAAVYALFLILSPGHFSLLGHYNKQTSQWKFSDLWVMLEAALGMPLLFCLSCFGVFTVLPFAYLRTLEQEKRQFIMIFTLGLLGTMVGVAVMVVPFNWVGTVGVIPLHLRYVSMFVPVFITFTLSVETARKKSKALTVALICLMVLSVVPGASFGFPERYSVIDNMALSAYRTTSRFDSTVTGILNTFLLAGGMCFMLLGISKGWNSRRDHKIAAILMAVLLGFNTVCVGVQLVNRPVIDVGARQDAREVNRFVKEKQGKCLGVMPRYYSEVYTNLLDVSLTIPIMQVTADQMYAETEKAGGVYQPFVPLDQSPNVGCRITPQTEDLVLSHFVANHLELSEYAAARKTENGYFTLVHMQEGKPWVDSMMYGLNDDTLKKDKYCCIHIYNANRIRDGQAVLHLAAVGDGTLQINDQTVQVSGGTLQRFDIPLSNVNPIINISAPDDDIVIAGYSLEIMQ